MKKLLKEYRIEAIAVLIGSLGVFLLVEQFEIRATLRLFLENSAGWLANLVRALLDSLASYILSFTLSDLVGLLLVIAATLFIIWRFRYHYIRSERWLTEACPRCGSPLHHIRRTKLDRLLTKALLPHGGRFLCSNSSCRWTGLCDRGDHHEHDHPSHPEQNPIQPLN